MTPRRRMFTIAFRIAASLALIATGSAIYVYLEHSRPAPAAAPREDGRPRVEVMVARVTPIARAWTGYGTARAFDKADISARVTATVTEIGEGILDGAPVVAGQLLMRLDDRDFVRRVEIIEFALSRLESQLNQLDIEERKWTARGELATEVVALTRADYDRASEAQRVEAIKDRELDRVRQALIAAIRDEIGVEQELEAIPERRHSLLAQQRGLEAEVRLSRIDVERCVIVAPIDGVVQSLDVEVGESVAVGARVTRIVGRERVEVPVRLPASARDRVTEGDDVTLFATNGQQWSTTIRRFTPEDDARTRTMTAFVDVTNGGDVPTMAPGRFVRAEVHERNAAPRWIVPRRAIDRDRLRLIVDGRVTSHPVEIDFQIEREIPALGLPDTTWVIVECDALVEGEQVLVNAARRLADGLEVVPIGAGGAGP